ncbi:hypothetical protein [Natronohydrobacter thiooxidans]|uniref:hypothetical protein n=1 Tax=Natronohydrobacter thiooxidans TaxID=87172 RepID=UPI000A795813|nr:hypothetical protein [Natronohydrobacter thiooxidans]
MPNVNRDAARVAVEKFMKSQKMLDMGMSLRDMSRKLGNDIDTVAGYTFAWDKYVYDIANAVVDTASLPPSLRGAIADRRNKVEGLLDMNTRVADLLQLTIETGIDEVAGYVYTADKNTFIVASFADEMISKT